MAKREMLCPFSDRLCKNCSLYIGKHYFLCYKPGYRGYIKEVKPGSGEKTTYFPGSPGRKDLDVPELEYRKDLDPFTRDECS